VRRWASLEQIIIDVKQKVDSQTTLQILVEKDFQCAHSKVEGNNDAFCQSASLSVSGE
jgi:hypothetical protein